MLLSLGRGITGNVIIRDAQTEECFSLSSGELKDLLLRGTYVKGIYLKDDSSNVDVRYYTDSRLRKMIERCNSTDEKYRAYWDVTIDKGFQDSETFFKWFESQPCRAKQQKDLWIDEAGCTLTQVDKDLFSPEAKEYSEKNCILLTASLNTIVSAVAGKRERLQLPRGISKHNKDTSIRAEFKRRKKKKWTYSRSVATNPRFVNLGMKYAKYYNLDWTDTYANLVGFHWTKWKENYIIYMHEVVNENLKLGYITEEYANRLIEIMENLDIVD